MLLTLFLGSLFLLIVIPIEIYHVFEARSWQPVEVEIVSHQIKSRRYSYYPVVRVRDAENGEITGRVSLRFGDFPFSLVVFGDLVSSSLYADRNRYPIGRVTTAFRSPDGRYVLEQNSPTLMLAVLLIACIYPAIALASLLKHRRTSRGSATTQ